MKIFIPSQQFTFMCKQVLTPFAKTFLILSFLFLNSCATKQSETNFSIEGMQPSDLSKYGKPFSIYVPDTLSSKLIIEEKVNGALEIKVGTNFAISINEQAADIELKKTDIKGDEVNKLKAFIIDKPDAILWESQINKPEYHFLVNQKIANSEYSFEDVVSSETKAFTKEAIQKMFDTSKNIQVNK